MKIKIPRESRKMRCVTLFLDEDNKNGTEQLLDEIRAKENRIIELLKEIDSINEYYEDRDDIQEQTIRLLQDKLKERGGEIEECYEKMIPYEMVSKFQVGDKVNHVIGDGKWFIVDIRIVDEDIFYTAVNKKYDMKSFSEIELKK